MDHDTHEPRIRAIESFLDEHARGWRGGPGGIRDARERGAEFMARSEPMVVDHEQTKRDRKALGLHVPEDEPQPKDVGGRLSGTASTLHDRLLARVSPFIGTDGFPELTGEETDDQLLALAENAERRAAAGGGSHRTPAQAVALEGANANPAAEQALQTEQDPARQERAEAQQQQKAAGESAGGIAAESMRR